MVEYNRVENSASASSNLVKKFEKLSKTFKNLQKPFV